MSEVGKVAVYAIGAANLEKNMIRDEAARTCKLPWASVRSQSGYSTEMVPSSSSSGEH